MGEMQGPHTLVLLGEASQAYPTSPFGLDRSAPNHPAVGLALLPPTLSACNGSWHGLIAAQMPVLSTGRGDHRGRDFLACKSHCLAISVSAQEGADLSRGKTSSQRFVVFATCKIPCSFSLSHAQQKGKTFPPGLPPALPPPPPASSQPCQAGRECTHDCF